MERELLELARRERAYRGPRQPFELDGRRVLLVDDGAATGATMRAAAAAARRRGAARVEVALPVATSETVGALRHDADEVFCVHSPALMDGVGSWYRDFEPVTDDEVRHLLARSVEATDAMAPPRPG